MALSRDDAFVFPARIVQKAMRLAEQEQRTRAIDSDIQTVLDGGEVSPEFAPNPLLTGLEEPEPDEPRGRVVTVDAVTGIPLAPRPYETPKTSTVTGVDSTPKSLKTPKQRLLTGVNSDTAGRGATVPPNAALVAGPLGR